jgi:hypothetical protein
MRMKVLPSRTASNSLVTAKTESIHAGNGEDTGMKWLLDKKNCLIIKYGEGFCRD